MDEHKRSGWAFWVVIAVLVPVLYVGSVGPVCRLLTAAGDPEWAVAQYVAFYAPLIWVYDNGPAVVREALDWYCTGSIF